MRRILAVLLIITLLCPRVWAAEEKYVALTFDDGPSGHYTGRLLEGLRQRGVEATFLLCGYRLEEFPGLAREIFEDGHEIGLHSYSHADMSKLNLQQLRQEIQKNLELLPPGCKPAFLRPPGGATGENVARAAREQGLALLKWSVDPRDWAVHDAAAVEAAVVENIQDGDVILLHDMCDCSVDAALAIIDRLEQENFHFVTVSQLAKLRGITPEPGIMYCKFP